MIPRRGEEPKDFWSQSLYWGAKQFNDAQADKVLVRFHNDGGRQNLRSEMHLAYRVPLQDSALIEHGHRLSDRLGVDPC